MVDAKTSKTALQVIYAASQYIKPGSGPKISLTKEIMTGLVLGLAGGVAWKVKIMITIEPAKSCHFSPSLFCHLFFLKIMFIF